MTKKKRNVISLFSGCGGTDVGFHGGFKVQKKQITDKNLLKDPLDKKTWIETKETSFQTVLANDIRPRAKIAFDEYFNTADKDVYFVESIVDLVKRSKSGEFIFPDADVVTGGFPCQDFSLSGKRCGFKSQNTILEKKLTLMLMPPQ